jgi:hypothetical protein
MKTASQFISEVRININKTRSMFRNHLSMHVMPVLLALAFIVVAERNMTATGKQRDVTITSKPVKASNHYLTSLSVLNAGNIQHVVTIYQVTRLAVNFIR